MAVRPLIRPVLQDDDFLEDVNRAREHPGPLYLWWLGQSGFLVQWEGKHLLFDPYLSDSLTLKYANTERPHVRMTELVVAPEHLGFVQVVTSSHMHTDHMDRETLLPLMKANPDLQLVVPEANREPVVDRLRVMAEWPHGLNAGQSVKVKGIRIHAVPAAHNTIERNEWGQHKYLGYVVELGPWRIYHAGDTLRYEGMEGLLRQWPVDVALLPINGDVPARGVAGNLNGREAAQLAWDIHARIVIPCHFEMFEFNTVSPAEFESACRALGQRYQVLRCGERWSSLELDHEPARAAVKGS